MKLIRRNAHFTGDLDKIHTTTATEWVTDGSANHRRWVGNRHNDGMLIWRLWSDYVATVADWVSGPWVTIYCACHIQFILSKGLHTKCSSKRIELWQKELAVLRRAIRFCTFGLAVSNSKCGTGLQPISMARKAFSANWKPIWPELYTLVIFVMFYNVCALIVMLHFTTLKYQALVT
jgi:hypothetical protein